MIAGQTSSSITKADIFSHFTEAEVLSSVFPDIKVLPCLMNSPFRQDSNPSFSIYLTNEGKVRYKDFGEGTAGSLLDLLCRYWNCTFSQALDKISHLLKGNDITIKSRQIKTFTRKEADQLTELQVAIRPWKDYDYEYWESYGITRKWLKYAEIYPISHKIITKHLTPGDKGERYIFSAPKFSYCYCERKEGKLSMKIYSPFSEKYKWCSKMDASVVSLWTKVPEFGDRLIIASSVKDALTLSCNLKIPAIAPQGEGYNLSDTAIKELKRRYKNIYISFDGDVPGIENAAKLSRKTGFLVIPCPILDTPSIDRQQVTNLIKEGLRKKDKAKDWSDIFLYFGKERFIKEFNNSLQGISAIE